MNSRWNSAAVIAAAIVICAVAMFVGWYVAASRKVAPAPRVSAYPLPRISPRRPARPTLAPSAVRASASPAAAKTAPAVRPSAFPSPSTAPSALNAGTTPTPMPIAHPIATIGPGAMPPVVREPSDAPPQILAFQLSSPVVQAGDVVSGVVETSSNVASVEARVGGYGASMQKVGVGRFSLTYRVPNVPFFLHRTFMVQIIARNTRGQAVSTAVPLTIR